MMMVRAGLTIQFIINQQSFENLTGFRKKILLQNINVLNDFILY